MRAAVIAGSRLPGYTDQLILTVVVFGIGRGTDERKSSEMYRPVRDGRERTAVPTSVERGGL
jgi:hypothetical protein